MLKILCGLILLYGVLVAALALGQRRLMYHPVKAILTPAHYGLTETQEHTIAAADGTQLIVWVHKAQAGFPTILYFHGNAGNLADRAFIFRGFIEAGFGIVALEYRGFGKSGGAPGEQGIYQDARAAIEYAATDLHIPQAQQIYYGESLGTGVAVQMATERPPALLMLEAAYTSVTKRSCELFPFVIGLPYFLHDHYDSLSKIGQIHVPLVMIHGENDTIIPIHHGRELFAAANEPKTLTTYPKTGHIDFTTEQRVTPLLAMARRVALIK